MTATAAVLSVFLGIDTMRCQFRTAVDRRIGTDVGTRRCSILVNAAVALYVRKRMFCAVVIAATAMVRIEF